MERKRVVVKVGTSTLTHDSGLLNLQRIDQLCRVLSDIKNEGREVILVTSGAIATGVAKMKLAERPSTVQQKQAVAAVGQSELMHIYGKFFSEYGYSVGQILLTRADLKMDERRQNLINTLETLLQYNAIPIINENDSVSYDEIGHGPILGDNDTLSAEVALMATAQLLVLLTDIDALYDTDPRGNPDAKRISVVHEVTDALRNGSGGAGTKRGTGGMLTKLAAAELALSGGIDMVVASGENPALLYRIMVGEPVGTLFRKE